MTLVPGTVTPRPDFYAAGDQHFPTHFRLERTGFHFIDLCHEIGDMLLLMFDLLDIPLFLRSKLINLIFETDILDLDLVYGIILPGYNESFKLINVLVKILNVIFYPVILDG